MCGDVIDRHRRPVGQFINRLKHRQRQWFPESRFLQLSGQAVKLRLIDVRAVPIAFTQRLMDLIGGLTERRRLLEPVLFMEAMLNDIEQFPELVGPFVGDPIKQQIQLGLERLDERRRLTV